MGITVDYHELQGYPRGRWVEGHFYGERRLRVAWSDVPTFIGQIGTYPDSEWPAATYGFGVTDALAREILIEPLPRSQLTPAGEDELEGLAVYRQARCTVRYSTSDFTWVNSALVKERFAPSIQTIRIPAALLTWSDGTPLVPGEDITVPIAGMGYTLSFHNLVTSPPDTTDWCGYVNSNTVVTYTLGRTMAAGTLLFGGSNLTVRFGYVGGYKWSVDHNFLYRRQGWNNHPRIGGGGGLLTFDTLKLKSTGAAVNVFPTTTF